MTLQELEAMRERMREARRAPDAWRVSVIIQRKGAAIDLFAVPVPDDHAFDVLSELIEVNTLLQIEERQRHE